jgi:hypothetical protein
MLRDFGKGDGGLSLALNMALWKWVIEFCIFGAIFIIERISNGSFLQSPWVFPSFPPRGFHSRSWARLKTATTSHGRSMKTDTMREIVQLMEGRALALSVMR